MNNKPVELLESATIRFAGDSGDGMQLTGSQFTNVSAIMGNDLATLPDYPAEIRAPAGTLAGVSGFQVQFSSHDIHIPGDRPDVLVAMNPAALKVNLKDMPTHATIIVNKDAFFQKGLELAGYDSNPLEDGSLESFKVIEISMTMLVTAGLEQFNLPSKTVARCKNFFALGVIYWMFNRDQEPTIRWIRTKFANKPELVEANITAMKVGFNYALTTEIFQTSFKVEKAKLPPGTYKNLTGNQATAYGLLAAAHKAGKKLFLGTYPITPASDILHELSRHKNFDVLTFQAEDEIAACCAAIGAAYTGAVAATSTSGPGLALKGEAIGLAVMTELPLVIVNVQRAGPSTGLPTKVEQADLTQALYGRNGEAPVPVLAASTPADCFHMAYEAVRIALKYMTPVLLLTDGYLANGAEPWRIPKKDELAEIHVEHATNAEDFHPYSRDEKGVRPWAIPGTPGLEHRIGGLEKQDVTGGVSYDGDNHDRMIRLRAQKIANIVNDVPDQDVFGNENPDLALVGWGHTFGAIRTATEVLLKEGYNVAHIHCRYINPLPGNFEEVLRSAKQVVVPEINLGQFCRYIRAEFLIPAESYNKVRGLPFNSVDIYEMAIEKLQGAEK